MPADGQAATIRVDSAPAAMKKATAATTWAWRLQMQSSAEKPVGSAPLVRVASHVPVKNTLLIAQPAHMAFAR